MGTEKGFTSAVTFLFLSSLENGYLIVHISGLEIGSSGARSNLSMSI